VQDNGFDAFVASLYYDSDFDFGDFFGPNGLFFAGDDELLPHSLSDMVFPLKLEVSNKRKLHEGFVEVDEQGLVVSEKVEMVRNV
jgi:hypothetical protein